MPDNNVVAQTGTVVILHRLVATATFQVVPQPYNSMGECLSSIFQFENEKIRVITTLTFHVKDDWTGNCHAIVLCTLEN